MIRMTARVTTAAMDTTSITAMATQSPTIDLAGVSEPKEPDRYHYFSNTLTGNWLPCIHTTF